MKLFAANIICAIGTAVGLSSPCWAQMQGHSITSDKVSAKCLEWVDVVVTFPTPQGRRVSSIVPTWTDVNNVGDLTEIKTEFSEGMNRVSGRLRGPPPRTPYGPSEPYCYLPGFDNPRLPVGWENSGSGSISVWYSTMPE